MRLKSFKKTFIKGIVERSGVTKTTTKQGRTGTQKYHSEKTAFILNSEMAQKANPDTVADVVITNEDGEKINYANTDNAALSILLNSPGFQDFDAVCAELKSRECGIRKAKNGKITIYKYSEKQQT